MRWYGLIKCRKVWNSCRTIPHFYVDNVCDYCKTNLKVFAAEVVFTLSRYTPLANCGIGMDSVSPAQRLPSSLVKTVLPVMLVRLSVAFVLRAKPKRMLPSAMRTVPSNGMSMRSQPAVCFSMHWRSPSSALILPYPSCCRVP